MRRYGPTSEPALAAFLIGFCLPLLPAPAAQAQVHPPSTAVAAHPTPTSAAPEDVLLQREKTRLEIAKLRNEEHNSRRGWSPRGAWNFLYENAAILAGVILGFVGLMRYLHEYQTARVRREEERFEDLVKGLGSEREMERVGSAVLLPTFLRRGYERFYAQVFNLAAGVLRQDLSLQSDAGFFPPGPERRSPPPIARALAAALKDSFPRGRDAVKRRGRSADEVVLHLNGEGVHLDCAFLMRADFRSAWFRQASFRGADLKGSDLTGAVLEHADLTGADLEEATVADANLQSARLEGASLISANLSGSRIDRARFVAARLAHLTMVGGTAGGADFSDADLTGALFERVDFGSGQPSKVEAAKSVRDATFDDVTGLTTEQVEWLRNQGAKRVRLAPPPRPLD